MNICGFTCMLQWVPMCRIGKFHKVLINSKLAAYKPHSNTWIQLEKFVEITQIEPMGLQMVKMTQIKMRLNLNFAVQTTFIKACCRKLASTFYGNCYFCTMMIRISFSFKAGPVYYTSWRKAYMGALASKASLQNEPILQALTSGNFVRKSRQRWVTKHSGGISGFRLN